MAVNVDLKEHYLRYISFLNERKVDDLGSFVQEELTYNGRAMSRVDYQNMIARDISAIPDLVFDVQMLVVDKDQVACRILFKCTPQDQFLGYVPGGKSIKFCEHVFYKFRDGRIYEVWSLLDEAAIAKQLDKSGTS